MRKPLLLAALTLVGTIYACGGGGGGTSSTTTSSGTSSSTIKLSGTAYDSAVESGTVTLYRVASDGSLTSVKSVSVSSNGSFSFSLSPGDLDNSTKYVIGVSGTIGGRDLKFFSPLGTGKEINDKAGQGGTVTEEDIPELVVSNVSTIDYLFLKSKYKNINRISSNEFSDVLAQTKASEMEKRLELAAVIKAYLDEGAQLASNIDDFKELLGEAWKALKDDGKLDTAEVRRLFKSGDDITKFALAKMRMREDRLLKKALYYGRTSMTSTQLESLVSGKTYYVKPSTYAPLYDKIHFNSNGTITAAVYKFNGTSWVETNSTEERFPFNRWQITNATLYMWGQDNIRYKFIPLAVDTKAVKGVLLMHDYSSINWLGGELYDNKTYTDINDFVNSFTNCQIENLFNATNPTQSQVHQIMSTCFMGAFQFNATGKKLIFKAPRFDSTGRPVGVDSVEMGKYSITNGVLKITFYPVKDDTKTGGIRIFPDRAKGVIFLKVIDDTLASQAQQSGVTLNYVWAQPGTNPGTPQKGNVSAIFGVAEFKAPFYKDEKYVKSKMLDPFAVIYAPPGTSQPHEGEVVKSFEKFVCNKYIGDDTVTLTNIDNSTDSIKLSCQNEELKITHGSTTVDFDESNATLTGCPMFSGVQSCSIVRADYEGVRICALNQNGEPNRDKCIFYTNDDRLKDVVMKDF
jgi:hypothetical protein